MCRIIEIATDNDQPRNTNNEDREEAQGKVLVNSFCSFHYGGTAFHVVGGEEVKKKHQLRGCFIMRLLQCTCYMQHST